MKRALLAALVAALSTAAVLATIGFGAQTKSGKARSTQDQQQSQKQSGPPPTMKEQMDKMKVVRDAQQKKLADAIGVSTDDLQKAMDKLEQDRLEADVKANRLTRAQMDAILRCKSAPLTCDRSNLPAGGRGRHGGDRPDKDQFAKDLAAALSIDESKVTKALESARPQRDGDGRGPGGHGPGGPDGPGMGGPGGPGMGGPGMGG